MQNFYAKFLLSRFEFSSDFYVLEFANEFEKSNEMCDENGVFFAFIITILLVVIVVYNNRYRR